MTLTSDDPYDPHAAKRCTAHSSRTGKPCKGFRVPGATVCKMHGGSAPQVKAKARQRLEEAADRMAKRVLGMAENDDIPPAVALAAAKDALDRAGLRPPTQVEVGVSPQPWESLISAVAPMTRQESRARRGIQDDAPRWTPPALPPGEIVDAEVVEASDLAATDLPATGQGKPPSEPAQPGTGLVTLAEANEALREAQRRHNEDR